MAEGKPTTGNHRLNQKEKLFWHCCGPVKVAGIGAFWYGALLYTEFISQRYLMIQSGQKGAERLRSIKLKTGIAVLASVCTLAGSGLVYAAPGVRDALESWYNESFFASTYQIQQGTINLEAAKLKAVNQQMSKTRQSGVSEIVSYEQEQSDGVNKRVQDRLHSYISQVGEASAIIAGQNGESGEIAGQFGDYMTKSTEQADQDLEQAAGELLDSMLQEP